ncbi:putative ribosome quality control (RQC) complex YloA/Tae2 family protein [Hymenobacter luteus]|uniref:Ribosome quality control (RQC) complex YloA/Tae2 family protein n=2 Tax=Hymenobacter TaxID=89966 RepID=A0ABR6JXQ0_9BACT|nr:NFACT RNA binding domain-containing protein [Hymenobacter latericoloratus]MBB4601505.1 putative ribosome quality control (RQC) complex YloA/Tae2 family protein [Hymenobacter latericoloratus]MBB6061447.1 putative ribosome quality control (RQC) complex YloA/Tae2 family protein [Hymenobacter luteus]
MHTNYYFLRQLAPALTQQLAGYTVVACFSQEKDELVLGLTNGAEEFWLRVLLAAAGPLISLPESFHRARQNSVDLLPELLGQQVAEVSAWTNDRVLQFTFQGGATLLLKLYSTRPNAIFRTTPEAEAQLFHQRYTADAELRPLAPGISPTPAEAASPTGNPLKAYPSLNDVVVAYLHTRGYDPAPLEVKWQLVREVVQELENPAAFYVIRLDGRTRLSLLPVGEVELTLPATDPTRALRRFVPLLLNRRAYEAELRQVRQQLEKRADEAATSAQHAQRRLHALENTVGYRQTADLIMAHLSQIPAGAKQVEVVDFYQDNQPRVIKLKPAKTPQRTAQNLYRKAKNQQLETRELSARAERRETEALWCLERLEELAALPPGDLRTLRQWRKQHGLDPATAAKAAQELPFKVFEDSGFTILVGRNAQNNDLLTQRYAHKDDLWLHAKDVTGSHVVIRQRPGHTVPAPVLERAAQLAAWYSRRKNDSLCPVTYTPKKFVRKPKGAIAGQVVVERENVLLVVPANPFERAE